MNWVVFAPAIVIAASMKNINRTLKPQPETGFFSGLLIPSWLQFLTIVKVKPSAVSPLENSADVKTTRLDISWWVLYLEYLEVAFCIVLERTTVGSEDQHSIQCTTGASTKFGNLEDGLWIGNLLKA